MSYGDSHLNGYYNNDSSNDNSDKDSSSCCVYVLPSYHKGSTCLTKSPIIITIQFFVFVQCEKCLNHVSQVDKTQVNYFQMLLSFKE